MGGRTYQNILASNISGHSWEKYKSGKGEVVIYCDNGTSF